MSDYDIGEALAAKDAGNTAYFIDVLPKPIDNAEIVVGGPSRPSLRSGWIAVDYPEITSDLIGSLAKDVLVEPTYPLDAPWDDPNPDTNDPAAYIGAAPDGTPSIEIRFEPGRVPQGVDAFIPLIAGGRTWAGVRMEVWHEAGFDPGPLGSGGKVAAGMWAGGRSIHHSAPWAQNGATLRNIWGIGSQGWNARSYSYCLNRLEIEAGWRGTNFAGLWTTGGWQIIEYEARINSPGFADGFARFWLDDDLVNEVTGMIWAINNEWGWRGVNFSDAWGDGTVPQSQKRWVRNISLYYPEVLTGYGNDTDGYVELSEAAFTVTDRTALGIGVSTPVNSGSEVALFANVATPPTSLGFDGGLLYVQSGSLYYRSSGGTLIQMALP